MFKRINDMSTGLILGFSILVLLIVGFGCIMTLTMQSPSKALAVAEFKSTFSPLPEKEDTNPDWGDSMSGEPKGEGWEIKSSSELTQKETLNSWSGIWKQAPAEADYMVRAKAQFIKSGNHSKYPKYGIYAVYQDKWNYFSIWLDKQYKVLATYGMVKGKSINWSNSDLPDIDFSTEVELKAIKIGNIVQVYVNGKLMQKVTLDIEKGQIGLVTEDTMASFKDIEVVAGIKSFD